MHLLDRLKNDEKTADPGRAITGDNPSQQHGSTAAATAAWPAEQHCDSQEALRGVSWILHVASIVASSSQQPAASSIS
jgi:hypothetical protein